MGTARRIYKNTMYLGIAEVASRVFQFVVMLYAARLLSRQDFGKLSFALSLSLIAIIFADLGINTLLIREIAREKKLAVKYFVNAAMAKIALSVITFIAVVIFLNVLGYPEGTRKIVYIIMAFATLLTFTELFFSIFRAFEMMFYDAFIKVMKMLLLAVAGVYTLVNGYGVVAFSYAFVGVEMIAVMIAFCITLKKFIKLKLLEKPDYEFMKSLIKKAIPFGWALVFGSIYFFVAGVILSKVRGDSEVAIYSAAYNVALAMLFIPTVYTNAIYPVLSRYYKEGASNLKVIYERSFKYLYIIGLPASAGLYFLAGRTINLLYGKAYPESVIVMQILAFYLIIKFINFLFGTVLSSIDQQNKRMASQGMTAAFNLALNLMLIPKIGYLGAAWAALITEVFLFFVYYYYVSKSGYAYNFANVLAKPIIGVLLMMLFIKFADFGLVLTIIFSAIVYFAVLWALRAFDSSDYDILQRMLKNEKVQAN